MHSRIAKLRKPLDINVQYLASFYPEFRYRGPYQLRIYFSYDTTSEYIMNDANPSSRYGFLKFDDKSDAGFGSVDTDFPPNELAVLFTRLPSELAAVLIDALKGTPLQIPTVSSDEHDAIRKKLEKKAASLEKLRRIKAPLRGARYNVDFKPEQSACILQGEYGLTNADSAQPILGTYAAGYCVILALYDTENKIAALTHIDGFTDLDSLSLLFNEVNPEHTVAHLAGGDESESSQKMCIQLVEVLNAKKIKIANADLVNNDYKGASLAIDARTGTIYSPVSPLNLSNTKDHDARLQLVSMRFTKFTKSPLHRYYHWSNPLTNEQMIPRQSETTRGRSNLDIFSMFTESASIPAYELPSLIADDSSCTPSSETDGVKCYRSV